MTESKKIDMPETTAKKRFTPATIGSVIGNTLLGISATASLVTVAFVLKLGHKN